MVFAKTVGRARPDDRHEASRRQPVRRIFAVLIGLAVSLIAATSVSAAGSASACTPIPRPFSTGYWSPFGNAVWTPDGLVTTSKADPAQQYGVTCGGAALFGAALPTSDPHQIAALSFDFSADRSGPSGVSPRLIVCFSDGPACQSNGNLAPTSWTANTWTHVDGFARSDGVTNVWGNSGGSCGTTYNTTWATIVACHPGASITEVALVNDSGSIYPSGTQVLLNNPTVNNVTAHAVQPVLAQSATVVPVAGKIMVKRHGSRRFVRVNTITSLHYGATVNAGKGQLRIFAANGSKGTQSGVFYGGSFKLTQNTTGLVQAALRGAPAGCNRPEGAHTAAVSSFHLWGHVKGKYRTRGRYGSASVRGTIWLTEERCNGTFFRVVEGTLRIRDFTRHRTIILHAGRSYLAPRPATDAFDNDGDSDKGRTTHS